MPVRVTRSLCPVCLRTVEAAVVRREQNYYLEKNCPEHGPFSAVIWRGVQPSLEEWEKNLPAPPAVAEFPDCPHNCGLCSGHLRQTCCALVEVTSRCNLACPVCFAQSAEAGTALEPTDAASAGQPALNELAETFRQLAAAGRTFVQLSGGEPTVREDLPEIVAAARSAGCATVQLNSNGLRLGREPGYAARLAGAGLSFVFMQFDGTEDAIYQRLRGQPLLAAKQAAIAACAAARLGVALVPTIVPGVNEHNIWAMLRFALGHAPAVRGLHFQPVSYLGRYPAATAAADAPADAERVTLPEVLRALERQSGGLVGVADFAPSSCDHPRCGFHGDFVVRSDGSLEKLAAAAVARTACCGDGGGRQSGSQRPAKSQDDARAHIKNRNFVARRWRRPDDEADHAAECEAAGRAGIDCEDMDAFLRRVKTHGFTITGMAFQDAWTLDLDRLRRCSLHVCAPGRVTPFCARYLTPAIFCKGARQNE